MHSIRQTIIRTLTTLKTSVFIMTLTATTLLPMLANPSTAHATTCGITCTYSDPWGTQEVAGSGWLNGSGVPIYSNGPSAPGGPSPDTYNYINNANGASTQTGIEWQCVELVNRLYIAKGWITSTWTGNGNQLYANAPTSLTKQANGSITNLAVGDVLSMSNGSGFGHAAVVNSVSGSSVTIASQNTNVVYDSTSFTISGGTISTTWSGYSVIGVIHAPTSGGLGGTVPTATGGPGIGVGNAVYLGTDHLIVNQTMRANQYITSSNVQSVLVMQSDGNLVLYTGPGYVATWSSGTYGNPGAYVQLQSNGDVVVYSAGGSMLWHSGNYGSPSELLMQPDGNLVEYGSGIAMWYTATGHVDNTSFIGLDRLNPSATMGPGNFIRSADGRYIVILQSDNNFVEYGPGWHALWNSHSGASGGSYVVMQPDGNLVEYTPNNTAVWYTATGGNGSSFATIQSDGNFVVYTTGGTPTWSDGAGGTI